MAGKGFGLGLGKMKEIAEAFKKAQQVQEGAQQLQEDLEKMEISGKSSDNLVEVVLSGNQEPLNVIISADAMGKSAQELSVLTLEAMKNAYQTSTQTMREKMEELTSGLNIPGL